jgi:hypothetical protein
MTLTLANLLHGNVALAGSDAYDQGYWDARNAYKNVGNFDDFCSFDNSDTYCFVYK